MRGRCHLRGNLGRWSSFRRFQQYAQNKWAIPVHFLVILSKQAFSFASSPPAIFLQSSAVLGSSAAKMGVAKEEINPNIRTVANFFTIMLLEVKEVTAAQWPSLQQANLVPRSSASMTTAEPYCWSCRLWWTIARDCAVAVF